MTEREKFEAWAKARAAWWYADAKRTDDSEDAANASYLKHEAHAAWQAAKAESAAELAALRRQLEACAIYLKPGETPRERMDRDAGDSAALMKLFEAEKRTTEALRSELEDARKALATCNLPRKPRTTRKAAPMLALWTRIQCAVVAICALLAKKSPQVAALALVSSISACGGGGASSDPRFTERMAGNEPYLEAKSSAAPTTLLVCLHTWSATAAQCRTFGDMVDLPGVVVVAPNLNGINGQDSSTCGSADVIARARRVIEQAKAEHPTVRQVVLAGASGGGYAALLLAGALPDLVDKVWAWEPVHDLAAWYDQSPSFRPDLDRCMGHAPAGPDDADYFARSPRGTLPATRADFTITVGTLDTTVPASHGRNAAAQIQAVCPTCRVTLVERPLPHQFWDNLSTLQAML